MSLNRASFLVSPRMPKVKRRKVVAMIVRFRSKEYRASLERQIAAGQTISIPVALHAELNAINAPYLKPKRITPQV